MFQASCIHPNNFIAELNFFLASHNFPILTMTLRWHRDHPKTYCDYLTVMPQSHFQRFLEDIFSPRSSSTSQVTSIFHISANISQISLGLQKMWYQCRIYRWASVENNSKLFSSVGAKDATPMSKTLPPAPHQHPTGTPSAPSRVH